MYYILRYILFFCCLFLFNTIDVFSDEEVIAQQEDYLKKLRDDKRNISDMLFNKKKSFFLGDKNSNKIKEYQENFKTHLINNYSVKDFIRVFEPDYKDYFRNRRYNFDVEKYNDVKKTSIANDTMCFFI